MDAPRLKMMLKVNGIESGCMETGSQAVDAKKVTFKEAVFQVTLKKGYNSVKLYSPLTLIPTLDCFTLEKV